MCSICGENLVQMKYIINRYIMPRKKRNLVWNLWKRIGHLEKLGAEPEIWILTVIYCGHSINLSSIQENKNKSAKLTGLRFLHLKLTTYYHKGSSSKDSPNVGNNSVMENCT